MDNNVGGAVMGTNAGGKPDVGETFPYGRNVSRAIETAKEGGTLNELFYNRDSFLTK